MLGRSLWGRLRHNVKTLGLGGALRKASHRVIGLPRQLRVRSKLLPFPVWLRLGTTDLRVLNAVLDREIYRFGMPSSAQVIVDAGANIGITSVYYAARFPEARIFALEPEPANFDMLRWNAAPYPNVVAIQAALWSHNGTVAVVSPGRGEWGFITREGTGVRAVTLASLCRECGIARIDLLKCDIEGAERDAFRSCDCMDSIENIVIELHDAFAPGCSAAVEGATRGFIRSQCGDLIWLRRP